MCWLWAGRISDGIFLEVGGNLDQIFIFVDQLIDSNQNINMQEVFIVAAVRTPIGSFGGSLSRLSATQLGGFDIKEAVKRAGIQSDQVEEVYFGNVLSANLGQAPATQAAKLAGLPDIPATTINKVCASGTKSIMLA